MNTPVTTASTALFHSASANTMCGFLPPSSKATRVTWGAAARAIATPVDAPPVKEIRSTSGVSVSAVPTAAPLAWIRFSTPAGTPASSANRTSAIVLSGVTSLGLATMVQPAASAGAIFQEIWSSG